MYQVQVAEVLKSFIASAQTSNGFINLRPPARRTREELIDLVLKKFDQDPRGCLLTLCSVTSIPCKISELVGSIEDDALATVAPMIREKLLEIIRPAPVYSYEDLEKMAGVSKETPIVDALINLLDVVSNVKARPCLVRTKEDLIKLILTEFDKDSRRVVVIVLNSCGYGELAKAYSSTPDAEFKKLVPALKELVTVTVKPLEEKTIADIVVALGIPPAAPCPKGMEDYLTQICLREDVKAYVKFAADSLRANK